MKINEEHSKTRNDIFNIKNDLDKNQKLINSHSKQIEEIFFLIEELNKNLKSQAELNEKALKEQIGKIQEYISNKIKEFFIK